MAGMPAVVQLEYIPQLYFPDQKDLGGFQEFINVAYEITATVHPSIITAIVSFQRTIRS